MKHGSKSNDVAFTLIELLMVITIIGLIAALAAPTLRNFRKGDATLAATQQMLDAVARARQLAISQRTTIYMVFVPTNYWNDPAAGSWGAADKGAAVKLADKILTGYNFISLRTVGDQPGQNNPRYMSAWQTLPESTMIAFEKFNLTRNNYYTIAANPPPPASFAIYGFDVTNGIPFPLPTTLPGSGPNPYPVLPYIAFDYQGRLLSGQDEYIPIAQGAVTVIRDPNRVAVLGPSATTVSVQENTNNVYNLIHIDWLTGRARVERPGFQ